MPKMNFDLLQHIKEKKTVTAYVPVLDGTDRQDIESYIRLLVANYDILESRARAFAVYRGISYLQDRYIGGASNQKEIRDALKLAATKLGLDKRKSEITTSLGATRFEDHISAIQRCVGRYYPDVRSMQKQAAILIHVGAVQAPKEYKAPTNDGWLRNFEFG